MSETHDHGAANMPSHAPAAPKEVPERRFGQQDNAENDDAHD